MKFLFFPWSLLLLFSFSPAANSNPNSDGWHLLMDNKPYEAREAFKKNADSRDASVAGEALRGLSEVCDFLGEETDAMRYSFKSGLTQKNAALFSAGIMNVYSFRSGASASIKDGVTLLTQLTKKNTIFTGEFQDLLAQRYGSDGDMSSARKIVATMASVKNWMMIGPFDNISNSGYNTIFPPESLIDFSKTLPGKDGNLTRWFPLANDAATGWIFTEEHSSATNAVVYYYCTVTTDQERFVHLSFGASGSFKIFLNRQLTLADSVFRNTGVDMFVQRVRLEKGANTLLVKLCHESGNPLAGSERLSNFNLRFLDERFAPAQHLSFSTVVPPNQVRAQASYASLAPSPLLDSMFLPLVTRLKNNPDDLDAAVLCMRSFNGADKTDEGQTLARTYLAKFPKSSLWHQFYGESLMRAKKYTESQTSFKTAYTVCSDNRAAWSNELATISKTADPRQILEFIGKSPPACAGSLDALMAEAKAHSELGNRAEALKNINEIEKNHSTDFAAIVTLVDLYRDQGDVRKAQKLMTAYLKHDRTNIDIYKMLAGLSLKQGDMSKAVDVILDALDYCPGSADLYYSLANMHYSIKKFTKALAYIEKCCSIMPADANALNLKGNILVSLNERDRALSAFNDAIEFTRDDFNAWENIRTLQNKPSLESLAPLPVVDSVISQTRNWAHFHNESGSILSLIEDVFIYPSRCSRERTFMVVHLPTQEAIDTWKERSIGYNKYFQDLSIEQAISYTAGGAQVQADIMDNRIVFKSLQPGDCIALEWSLKNYYSGEMARHVYGEEDFQRSFPVFDGRLRLVTPRTDTVPFAIHGDSISVNATNRDDYRVADFNRAPYKNPLDETFSAFEWPGRRKVTYSTFSGWGDIVKWYDGVTRHKLDNTLELRALADSLFKSCATPQEKATAMHRYITGTIRYSYVPFRQSNWIPQDAHDVLATKIGDCKDMASLGKSLLDYAGVPACLVLVNTNVRHFTGNAFVGPDFNHCILCYSIDNKDHFMDLTDNNLSASSLPKDDQGAMALIIRPGESALTVLPSEPPEKRVKRRTIVATVDDSGALIERGKTLRTGIYAAQYREIFRFESEEKKRSTMHKILSRYYRDLTLDSFSIGSTLNSVSDSLSYSYAYRANNAVTFSGATAILALHTPDNIEPDDYPVENKRRFPVDMYHADYDICSMETKGELVFPKKWRPIILPEKISLSSPWGEYHFDFTQKGNTIRYVRTAAFHFNAMVQLADYERLKGFLNSISKADAVQLLFYTR
jgi:tetratricopeptide (TPR) repeat protein